MLKKIICDIEPKTCNDEKYYKNLKLLHKLWNVCSNYKKPFEERMGIAMKVFRLLFGLEAVSISHIVTYTPFNFREVRNAVSGQIKGMDPNEEVPGIDTHKEIEVRRFYPYIDNKNGQVIFYCALEKSLQNKITSELVFKMKSKSDLALLSAVDGEVVSTAISIINSLEQGFALEKIGEEKDKLRANIDNSPNGIILLNRNMSIENWNEAMVRITGLSWDDVLSEARSEYEKKTGIVLKKECEIFPEFSGKIQKALKGLINLEEIIASAYRGNEEKLEVHGVRFKDRVYQVNYEPRKRHNKITGLDITIVDETKNYVELNRSKLFNYDYYVLFNGQLAQRLKLNQKNVHQEMTETLKYYGMMLDIDNFKTINTDYGHECGDYVICEIGKIIKEIVGQEGVPIRIGGDEFYIIFENTEYAEVLKIAEQIKQKIATYPINYYDKEKNKYYNFTRTTSIGIGLGHETDPEKTKIRADNALYAAKDAGRDCIRFVINSTKEI